MSDQEQKQEQTTLTPQSDTENKKVSRELSEEELKKTTGGVSDINVTKQTDTTSPKLFWKEDPNMSNDKPVPDKVDPNQKKTTISPDDLTKTSKSGDIELDEEELNRATGGKGIDGTKPYLKNTWAYTLPSPLLRGLKFRVSPSIRITTVAIDEPLTGLKGADHERSGKEGRADQRHPATGCREQEAGDWTEWRGVEEGYWRAEGYRHGDQFWHRIPALPVTQTEHNESSFWKRGIQLWATNKSVPDKADLKNKETKISPADDLVKTSKSGDVELEEEEELKRVSGGTLKTNWK
jgi:hypothetical protein